MEYAWLLTDEVRHYLLAEADRRGLNFYLKRRIFPKSGPRPALKDIPYEQVLNEGITMERAAWAIVKEMDIGSFPTGQFITMVLVPDTLYSSAFTVYSNHEFATPASDAAVRAVGERLGFVGMPQWYPSGVLFQWVEE